MKKLLKKLFERRREEVTILLFDDDNPHQQENYTLKPGKLMALLAGLNIAVVLLVFLLIYFTPLGTYFFNKENRAIRSSVIQVHERVLALQDSLKVRDQQLHQIQRVIRDGADTVFDIRSTPEWDAVHSEPDHEPERATVTYRLAHIPGVQSLQGEQIIHSDIFSGEVRFPAEPPVSGTLTGRYQPDIGHFGLDIAARKGTDVRTVADGVIASSEWTINNGYSVHILHAGGYATIYKHFSEVIHRTGDVVRKGDVIGKVGETGLLASGPHVHFELWKNGVSLDPEYYINVN
ncbi:MAG: M23 family metallopeptidase [Balneolaceae bacterium]|nr:MAG: M23 family metallopeptidase [Balneolaceae bacterium]